MKIYTDVQNYCGKLMVGTVLVSDQDQIYMMNGNELQTDDVDQAHIYGIKRAMSFVKSNKPLYAKEDITVKFENNETYTIENSLYKVSYKVYEN